MYSSAVIRQCFLASIGLVRLQLVCICPVKAARTEGCSRLTSAFLEANLHDVHLSVGRGDFLLCMYHHLVCFCCSYRVMIPMVLIVMHSSYPQSLFDGVEYEMGYVCSIENGMGDVHRNPSIRAMFTFLRFSRSFHVIPEPTYPANVIGTGMSEAIIF